MSFVERAGINSEQALQAAGAMSKLLPFRTDLVAGHCTSVDPNYVICRSRVVGYLQRMIMAMDEQIRRISGSVEKLNGFLKNLPNTQLEVLRMVRDVEGNAQLYAALLNTTQEFRVVKAGTIGNVRVVDNAVAPYKPIKPKKSMIVLLSLMPGAFAGVVLAFVRRALSGGVEDPDLIEKWLNVPVCATIAHSKNQDRIFKRLQAKEAKRAILAIKHPDDISIESLRNIRTAPHFGMVDVKSTVTMATGSTPGIGIPFGSTNLAAIIATSGKKRRSWMTGCQGVLGNFQNYLFRARCRE